MARAPVVPPELTQGPFTRAEALCAGLTPRQLQGSTWHQIGGGLYIWAGLPLTPALMLVALHRRLPPSSAFSGRTAAWLHGLDLPPCDPVEATIPDGCGVSARAGISIWRARLPSHEVVQRRGLPATSPLRTAFDLGARLPLMEAVVAIDMALHQRLVRRDRLEAYVAGHSRRKGVARLRRAVALADPRAESPMETRLRLLLVLARLPRPEVQVRLHDDRGRFVARTDLYYPDQRLCLEYDGATHRDSLVDDDRRQNRLLNAGFRLLRFTAADVLGSPDEVVAEVRAALHPPATAPNSRIGFWGSTQHL